jgi:hypothetical protein
VTRAALYDALCLTLVERSRRSVTCVTAITISGENA